MKYLKEYEIRGLQIDNDYRLLPEALFPLYLNTFACECDDKGLAAYDLQPYNKTWVVSDFYGEFSADMPTWRSAVEVSTFNSKITDLRLFKEFEIKCAGKLLAKGISAWFVMNIETHRPEPILDLKDKFLLDNADIIPVSSLKLRNFPTIEETPLNYKIRLRDTDFNHHFNSIRYMQLALSELDDDFIGTKKLRSLHLKFLKEAFWKDFLAVGHSRDKDTIFHVLKHNSEDICRIKTTWE